MAEGWPVLVGRPLKARHVERAQRADFSTRAQPAPSSTGPWAFSTCIVLCIAVYRS
jgi:hypothetical protein